MKKSILVVTHRRGFEADPVIDELRKRGLGVFRFNSDDGKASSQITFTSERNSVELVCDGRKIESNEIKLGWCQQLPPYLGQAGNKLECLQRENLLAVQFAALDFLPVAWFNKPGSIFFASNKLNQMVAASEVGLVMPKTLVSNNPEAIRSFAQGKTIIAKNFATPWVISEEGTHAAYTRIVDPSWLSDDAAISFTPVIYQEFYERKRDIRVVIIKDKVFAASCVPGITQREDIRKGCSTGDSFEKCVFDEENLKKIHYLMQKFKLDYCSADFMEVDNGKLLFLEVNTCGAWWWVDRLYKGEICHSLTNALIS